MDENDRIAIMAAIIAGSRAQKFEKSVRDEVIAADALRLARAIDKQARGEHDENGAKGPLFKQI